MSNNQIASKKPPLGTAIAMVGVATIAYYLGLKAKEHGGILPAAKELGKTGSVIFGKFRGAANDDQRLPDDRTATGT